MSNAVILMVVVAAIIIIGLAVYAGSLLAKLRQQQRQTSAIQQEQQATISKNNDYLVDSITLIAKAVAEQQCELSEAAIRICRLLEKVYVIEDASYPAQYPALHQLDAFLADYPTHAGYKALKRQERMRFDVKRAEQEQALKSEIEAECTRLIDFSV